MTYPLSVDHEIDAHFAGEERHRVRGLLPAASEFADEVPYERVLLGVLRLSTGKVDKLAHFVDVARHDWRDVLYWSETAPATDEPRTYEALRSRLRLKTERQWPFQLDREKYAIGSLPELEEVLDTAQRKSAGRGRIAMITSPDGPRLDVGVGLSESFLQFTQGDDDPYLISVGSVDTQGVEVFSLEGHETEIPRRNLIPVESARHAAAVFFQTGVRPASVGWEEV